MTPLLVGGASVEDVRQKARIQFRFIAPNATFRSMALQDGKRDDAATSCPFCGGDLSGPRPFNLMFKTHVGATEDESSITYLRPETAQSIFVQFKNILEVSRKKLPFGIAQIGKAFRNEINPRNFTFRSREFEQMELEYFCRPEQGMALLEYWKKSA